MTLRDKKTLSTIIVIFFLFCLFQPLASEREDWPFSYFGMYKGRLNYNNITRYDIDVIFPDGRKESIFGHGYNFNYVQDVMEWTIRSADDLGNEEVKKKLENFLKVDIFPLIKKRPRLQTATELQIRYRHWAVFSPDKKDQADSDLLFIRLPLSLHEAEGQK